MAKLTVEISDSIHQWLNAEAGSHGLSLDQFVTNFLAEQHGKSKPTASEIAVLGILQNVSERRGWVVPVKLLRNIWNIRGTAGELETALGGLIGKGFVEQSQNGMGYALTSFGFNFQTKTEFA